jgi:hypothetical protein
VAVPLSAADEIVFRNAITAGEFQKFARIVGQGIYASPVQPARASGLLGFDIGVSATAMHVDTNAAYWQNAVDKDITTSGYVAMPRVIVSKGFSVTTVSAMYAKISDTGAKNWGAAVDVPIIDGGVVRPTLAARATYSALSGVEHFDLKTYGAEIFLSKGIGPVTPYGAIGKQRIDAKGQTDPGNLLILTRPLSDKSTITRYTAGVRLSFFIPKICVEVTQAEVRSYAAKISIGL